MLLLLLVIPIPIEPPATVPASISLVKAGCNAERVLSTLFSFEEVDEADEDACWWCWCGWTLDGWGVGGPCWLTDADVDDDEIG